MAGGIGLETVECGRGEVGLWSSSVEERGGCCSKFNEDTGVLKLPKEDATMTGESSGDSDEAGVIETINVGTAIYGKPKCSGVTGGLVGLTGLDSICEGVW